MKKINFNKIALAISGIALMCFTSVSAQDTPAPTTTFAGSVDMYYKYDFSKHDNSKTSFTNSHNSFELGMASIEASHKLGKASVFVDLGFGTRASQFTYNDASNTFMIKQAYVTYDFSPSFKITAGSFGTHIGYELLDAVDNKNYSMSYAFTNGPFFNTGVKAQYTSGKFSIMAGVTNPTDFKTALAAGSTQKTFIGQLAYVGETGSAYFNLTSGSANQNPYLPVNPNFNTLKNKTQFDFVGSKKLSDSFSLGVNATYAIVKDDLDSAMNGNWYSLVGYASYAVKKNVTLAYRAEYFDDKDAVLGIGANVFANTLSLNFKEGNFTLIPEIRIDSASQNIFTGANSPKGSSTYALIATTYSF